MRRLRNIFPDELVVIGVHSAKFPAEQHTQNIYQAVMRHGIEHPVINDADFKIWNSYTIRAWPSLVLIGPDGRIAGETSGEILAEDFIEEIKHLIDLAPEAINRAPLGLQHEVMREPERTLNFPARVLVSGNTLFISDTGHHRILEVRLDDDGLSGDLVRVIGSGEPGLVDGSAELARFNHPHGLSLRGEADNGVLFVADTENHAIRAVELINGSVRTLAGTGQKAHGRITGNEPLDTPLRSPWAVHTVEHYLFIAMAGSHQVWVMIDEQQIGPFAGNGAEALVDGPLAQSSFNQPSDLAYGMGYLFVADPEASAVRAISLTKDPQTVTLVGQGLFDFGDQDGPTDSALLQHPIGLAVSGRQVFVADSYNHKIKLLDPLNGTIATLTGNGSPGYRDGSFDEAQLFEPEGVIVEGNFLYIADTNNHQIRVAELKNRMLYTFNLRGIDRLPKPEMNSFVEKLDSLEVAVGVVQINLDVCLPAGYKLNQDAQSIIYWKDLVKGDESSLIISTAKNVTWKVYINADTSLSLRFTIYYCKERDSSLCFIDDRQVIIPLTVIQNGPAQVSFSHQVEPPV